MKIFGFEIRKFEKEPTTIQVIETWNVRWWSVAQCKLYGSRYNPKEKENVQGFPTKEAAESYAKELSDARRLLGDIYDNPAIEVQKIPSNV
jgi:Rieske Fe-S protein